MLEITSSKFLPGAVDFPQAINISTRQGLVVLLRGCLNISVVYLNISLGHFPGFVEELFEYFFPMFEYLSWIFKWVYISLVLFSESLNISSGCLNISVGYLNISLKHFSGFIEELFEYFFPTFEYLSWIFSCPEQLNR